MRRVLLILIALPLVVLLAAALLIPLLLDKETILKLAAEQVERQTGATLTVAGEVDFSIIPRLGLALGDVSLAMPGEERPALQARGLEIGVQLLPLLSKEVLIDALSLDGVIVRIESEPAPPPVDTSQMSDDELRAFYAKRRADLEAAGRTVGAESVITVPLALNVKELQVTDSRLEMSEAGGGITAVEIVQLTGSNLNLEGRGIPLQAKLRLPGEQVVEIDLDGAVVISQETDLLTLQDLNVKITGAGENAIALHASGELDLQRQVADLDLEASIGETEARGQLRYASFESPQIDTTLKLNLFDPALLALAGPEAAAAEAEKKPDSEDEDIPLPLDALRVMDTRAHLTIDRLIFEAHEVEQLEARLRVVDGVAILAGVTGRIHGGELNMKGNLNAKHSTARVNAQGTINNVDIASVLKAVDSAPVLSGRADLNWKLHGRGNSSKAISRSLQGPIDLVTRDAVLTDMGVEKMMCEAVALANREALSASFPASSSFQTLAVDIELGGGQARLQPLKARLGEITLTGTGELDMDSLDFDTTFKARLSPGLEKLDPACRVNQRITAIDWPVNCRGNVTGEPGEWCAVDTAEIIEDLATQEIKRKAQEEIERKLGKEAGGLLDSILGK